MKHVDPHQAAASLGERVRAARGRAQMTQAQLAEAAQVSRSFVLELERGHARAELGKVIAVLSALDVNVVFEQASPRPADLDPELPASERARALRNIMNGWTNNAPAPDEVTQQIVRDYVAGT